MLHKLNTRRMEEVKHKSGFQYYEKSKFCNGSSRSDHIFVRECYLKICVTTVFVK